MNLHAMVGLWEMPHGCKLHAGAKLYVGDEGIVHAVPGEHAQLGCTFGALRLHILWTSQFCRDVHRANGPLERLVIK